MSLRSCSLLLVVVLLSCGRTEPVHYSTDGGGEFVQARLPDGGVACEDGTMNLLPARPLVMLVLDRSSSMSQTFPGTGSSKWNALRGALRQALPPWGSTLELGALVFPTGANSSCSVSSTVDVAPALDNVAAVLAKLDATGPGGATPTALAIEAAGTALRAVRTAGSARAVVLATDGAPDCNSLLNSRSCTCLSGGRCTSERCLDDTRSIGRIAALASSGIPTWVVGLRSSADAVFVDVLNRMADAGGKPLVGGAQKFYSASSQQELETALDTIRQQVGRCHYLTPSVPDVGGTIGLQLDGAFVPFDSSSTEGWSWVDANNGELALYGETCTRAEGLPPEALLAVVQCGP